MRLQRLRGDWQHPASISRQPAANRKQSAAKVGGTRLVVAHWRVVTVAPSSFVDEFAVADDAMWPTSLTADRPTAMLSTTAWDLAYYRSHFWFSQCGTALHKMQCFCSEDKQIKAIYVFVCYINEKIHVSVSYDTWGRVSLSSVDNINAAILEVRTCCRQKWRQTFPLRPYAPKIPNISIGCKTVVWNGLCKL